MKRESRTAKSFKNSSVALVFYFINLVLQFFSRKIFLDHLGTEILGLNTTATNLLQFLNLAELGIGTAVGFSLYKPFYDRDTQTINEIVTLQGKLYRRIAYIVIAGSAVLMCFFPLIFAKMTLPLWYAYASFGVLLFSSLLSYFVNYKQILLSADQKEYKIQYSYNATMLTKIFVQILAIKYFANGYAMWLVLEVVFAVVASYVLQLTVKNTYPFIKDSDLSFNQLNAKYPAIQTKIKQLFAHKISAFVLHRTSFFIIYGFASLTLVALYGNYMLIVTGLVAMANALSNGLTASIGNMVAEGNRDKILDVFEELFSVRFFITAVMCFGMYTMTQPLITLWIGDKYLLPMSTLTLITAILFVSVSRFTVESFLIAYGFFSDIWAPVIEATLNIGLSILLGYYFGLNGILSGVLISLIIVILGWKPVFLFFISLKTGYLRYVIIYVKHILIGSIVFYLSYKTFWMLFSAPATDILHFILQGSVGVGMFTILLWVVLYFTKCGVYTFCKRFMANIQSIRQ